MTSAAARPRRVCARLPDPTTPGLRQVSRSQPRQARQSPRTTPRFDVAFKNDVQHNEKRKSRVNERRSALRTPPKCTTGDLPGCPVRLNLARDCPTVLGLAASVRTARLGSVHIQISIDEPTPILYLTLGRDQHSLSAHGPMSGRCKGVSRSRADLL